jgi:cytochrome b561
VRAFTVGLASYSTSTGELQSIHVVFSVLFARLATIRLTCWGWWGPKLGARRGHMVHISEELKAAKAAKAVISVLLKATPKSAVLATLNKANHAAILNLSSGGALNEARAKVGIVLSNLIHDHGPPTPLSIDRAKFAIEAWIRELEASPAA